MIRIISKYTDGHRREFVDLFCELLNGFGQKTIVISSGWPSALSREPLFFLMVEEFPFSFFCISFLRSLFLLRTVGFLFRFGECVAPISLRTWIKRVLLTAFRLLPRCAVIALLPLELEERLKTIARFGIYCPQLWDLVFLSRKVQTPSESSELIRRIDAIANGRKICVALGKQSEDKGFNYFCHLWNDSARLRENFLFVSAGAVARTSKFVALQFQSSGGFLLDRYLSDDEVTELYSLADVIWSCYSPKYNQASGIFGRSVQHGLPAIIRKGSYLESLASSIGHPTVGIPWNDMGKALEGLASLPERNSAEVSGHAVRFMRLRSLADIQNALGLAKAIHLS